MDIYFYIGPNNWEHVWFVSSYPNYAMWYHETNDDVKLQTNLVVGLLREEKKLICGVILSVVITTRAIVHYILHLKKNPVKGLSGVAHMMYPRYTYFDDMHPLQICFIYAHSCVFWPTMCQFINVWCDRALWISLGLAPNFRNFPTFLVIIS